MGPAASVGPTYQCLPRPATRELLYNRLSVSLHHHQDINTHNCLEMAMALAKLLDGSKGQALPQATDQPALV